MFPIGGERKERSRTLPIRHDLIISKRVRVSFARRLDSFHCVAAHDHLLGGVLAHPLLRRQKDLELRPGG